mmetsp:Transcript_62507/g.171675  ORF Transcript_62507/g.171675 Transcript_62507/m.171675 type:complete len:240 (+) Transcript_62507:530-1249(+)
MCAALRASSTSSLRRVSSSITRLFSAPSDVFSHRERVISCLAWASLSCLEEMLRLAAASCTLPIICCQFCCRRASIASCLALRLTAIASACRCTWATKSLSRSSASSLALIARRSRSFSTSTRSRSPVRRPDLGGIMAGRSSTTSTAPSTWVPTTSSTERGGSRISSSLGYCESHEMDAPRATKPCEISKRIMPGERRAYLSASSLAVVVDMNAISMPPRTPAASARQNDAGSAPPGAR